jgi:hypothetical protein
VITHANLPTITHCYAQLLDIIHSRDLQTVTSSTQPAVSQRYATSSGTVAIAPGGYATPSWTTRYSGATTTLVTPPAAW